MNGIVVAQLGDFNRVSAAMEAGIELENIAESGLIDYQQLQDFRQL